MRQKWRQKQRDVFFTPMLSCSSRAEQEEKALLEAITVYCDDMEGGDEKNVWWRMWCSNTGVELREQNFVCV